MSSTLFGLWMLKFKAYLLDDVEALHELGALYGSGEIKEISGELDKNQAYRYYKKAAEKGHPESQYDLAFIYWVGDLHKKDEKSALFWLRKSAAQGYEPAIDFLQAIDKQ